MLASWQQEAAHVASVKNAQLNQLQFEAEREIAIRNQQIAVTHDAASLEIQRLTAEQANGTVNMHR